MFVPGVLWSMQIYGKAVTKHRADLWVRFCGFFKSRRGLYPSPAGKSPRPQTKEQMTRRQQAAVQSGRLPLHFEASACASTQVLRHDTSGGTSINRADRQLFWLSFQRSWATLREGKAREQQPDHSHWQLADFGKDGNGCRHHSVRKPSPRFRNTSRPWNKGRLLVQKRLLQPKQAWVIRPRLELAKT